MSWALRTEEREEVPITSDKVLWARPVSTVASAKGRSYVLEPVIEKVERLVIWIETLTSSLGSCSDLSLVREEIAKAIRKASTKEAGIR